MGLFVTFLHKPLISLYNSFIYEDIFTKFAENIIYKKKKKNGLIADCSKIIKMFENLKYCMYMNRNAGLTVILALF